MIIIIIILVVFVVVVPAALPEAPARCVADWGKEGGSYEKLSARIVKSPPWKHNAGPDFKAITLFSNVQNVHTDKQRRC